MFPGPLGEVRAEDICCRHKEKRSGTRGGLAPARKRGWCGRSWTLEGVGEGRRLHTEGGNHADKAACRVQAKEGLGEREGRRGGQALEVP